MNTSKMNTPPKMSTPEFRKQISIFVPLPIWQALRAEAARQKLPISEMCRRWIIPHLENLKPVEELSTTSPTARSRQQFPKENGTEERRTASRSEHWK